MNFHESWRAARASDPCGAYRKPPLYLQIVKKTRTGSRREKILPPARLQAGGAPTAGLLLQLLPCRKSPAASPLPPACSYSRPSPPTPAAASPHELDAVAPPQASSSQSEQTRSSASLRATPSSSHACWEAMYQWNRGRLLPLRPPLAHTSSTPSRLLRLPRASQQLQRDLLVLQEPFPLSIACWFARPSWFAARHRWSSSPELLRRPKTGGAATEVSPMLARMLLLPCRRWSSLLLLPCHRDSEQGEQDSGSV